MREFGSEFENISLSDNYFSRQCNLFKNYEYTRSGREAISLIAVSIKENTRKEKLVVLLPSYICPSMLAPFENNVWDVYYYNLNRDFSIDKSDITAKIILYQPTSVLIVSYFGNFVDAQCIDLIKNIQPKVNIVYDFTHSLLSLPQLYNNNVDYYVASLRKWFGIADGGLVLTNNFLKTDVVKINDNTEYINLRELSLDLKRTYLSSNDINLKIKYKDNLRKAEASLNTELIYRISNRSLTQINSLNVSEITKKRNTNFVHLWTELKTIPNIRFAVDIEIGNIENYNFMLPLLLENRDEIQKIFSDNGLYTQVIWKIPNKARQCKDSEYISDRILCIPIDQRYNYWDIENIAKIIKEYI